ncbi:hypothetical protein ACFGVS_04075 [Mucilaginibacter sp. AW1-7]|jgi:hypothetical protein|uniref:hypothetical protein n=1 Tax=unclassified Mucilaginibacter TaxID=2617802 RepID=UPI00236703BA|nr:hypothetical protein [Mucilaginibacter sp. KACC 22773]WDF80973.1 hypothetical protein PQ469_13260 [Mucilaginibacter sp. KACC 22773]
MKKIYLSAILATGIALSASAQKLEKPEIDKIKGDTTWKTSDERIYTQLGFATGRLLYVYAEKIGTSYVLCFRIDNMNGPRVWSIGPANITNIKFTDNSVLDLKPDVGGDAHVTYGSQADRIINLVYYKLEKDDIETLKTKSVSIIRIATDGAANFDYEIKPKNADLIKKDLELILTK